MISVWLAGTLLIAPSSDARWTPFLGCWSLVEDELRRPLLGDPAEEAADAAEEDRPLGLVCLAPEGDGVRLQTYSGDEDFLEETLTADGRERDSSRGRCRGSQQLDWSKDASLLFTRSELTCEEGRTRSITGISLLTSASTWVEIESIGTGDGRAVLIRRFRAVSEEVSRLRIPSLSEEQFRDAVEARLRIASNPMSLEDVIEASARVAPEVVEASILERGGRFPIDGESLVRLSDASVPPSVIDLMVALSFPEEFAVERASDGGAGWGYSGYDPFFDSAFAYPYYFAPFGYYYWYAPWSPIYGVPPGGTPGATVGRVVEGRGYTRVTRAEPFDSGERRAHRRGESGGSDSGSSSGSSSSSGSVSRGGYSRSGGSQGTAKPKKQ
jgi:uncharacterized membrane protein YgcG